MNISDKLNSVLTEYSSGNKETAYKKYKKISKFLDTLIVWLSSFEWKRSAAKTGLAGQAGLPFIQLGDPATQGNNKCSLVDRCVGPPTLF